MQATIPAATYRLQFNSEFRFRDATALAGYLDDLGISHCYASPLLVARPGSRHGYDVVYHGLPNPELGSEQELTELAEELARRGMSLLLDVVPNHMCIAGSSNSLWTAVMEDGPGSPYAAFFDIDWKPPKSDIAGKVLLPVLGDQFGRVLEKQEIQVRYSNGAFQTCYWDLHLPLAPKSWHWILQAVEDALREPLGQSDPAVMELESIVNATVHLPPRDEVDPARVRERQREKQVIKKRLSALVSGSQQVREALDRSLEALNGTRGVPRSFDRLESLLAEQAYRLSFWRVAADEINYRRFFTVNELAAIRVEEPQVFAEVHRLPLEWIRRGWVTGLRVDHPDGLFDPRKYLRDLQEACQAARAEAEGPPEPSAGGTGDRPFYVVVEKILVHDEQLQADWPVYGTTGYDFLNDLNGIFIDPASERQFRALFDRLTDRRWNVPELVYECKKHILDVAMSAELEVLGRRLDRISELHRWSRDFTFRSLLEALEEIIACFPVYRTYTSSGETPVGADDRRHVAAAVRAAKRRNPATNESIFDFISSVLLFENVDGLDDSARALRREFSLRLQQLTGPIMAKGVEDTAFYRYHPLASLNEVGGELERFGLSLGRFHARNQARLVNWPHALSATSTHDTKRSEDVRARLDVLSELPEAWEQAVLRWQVLNRPRKARLEGFEFPLAADEYLLYQTLVGSWPFEPLTLESRAAYLARVQEYAIKAAKEASVQTSWFNPNEEYEQALREFAAALLEPGEANEFLADFLRFIPQVSRAGMLNSLAQVLLKLTSPGVPDIYQGTELWNLSLVDPDNRRTVDFAPRRQLLEELGPRGSVVPPTLLADMLDNPYDGRLKLYLTSRALAFRRSRLELFQAGDYDPLRASGERARHVVAFARRWRERRVVVVTGRFFSSLGEPDRLALPASVWAGTSVELTPELANVEYVDAFTGAVVQPLERSGHWELPLENVLSPLPAALLAPAR